MHDRKNTEVIYIYIYIFKMIFFFTKSKIMNDTKCATIYVYSRYSKIDVTLWIIVSKVC